VRQLECLESKTVVMLTVGEELCRSCRTFKACQEGKPYPYLEALIGDPLKNLPWPVCDWHYEEKRADMHLAGIPTVEFDL
jgi:hypothetical protein